MTQSINDAMSNHPKVSVIVPCFNAAATIEATIASVRAQCEAAIEMIVIDDGSTDGTANLVRSLTTSDSRLRLIEQANGGPSVARNRGVVESFADIVAFLDADDLWQQDHLKRHLTALAADDRLGVSFSPCTIIDQAGLPTGETTRTWLSDVTLADILACNPTATCSSIVARRQVFDDAGLMRTDMSHAEDQEWLFRVIRSKWLVRGIPRQTVVYRTSPGGLSASTERMLAGWQVFVEHARKLEPSLVQKHEPRAASRMHFYLTRRAIRTGQPGHVARGYFARAIAASPRTAAHSPLQTAALAGACLAPRLANTALATLRSLRYE
ncbi:MAG: glycosyltransferase family 2 protein [Hyphomicrobiaceae bacterium]